VQRGGGGKENMQGATEATGEVGGAIYCKKEGKLLE